MDVSEPEKLLAFMKAYQIETITHILTTHKHADHSGGNKHLLESYPNLTVIGGALDQIPGCTHPVQDGDTLNEVLGDGDGVKIRCLHTPCHTKGHILYYCEAGASSQQDFEVSKEHEGKYQHIKNVNRCVFTGDTIFLGGCGRFFEGTADQMLAAFDRFSELPEDTKVFCGHEYTVKNLEFALQAEPENPHIKEYFEKYSETVRKGFFTVPALIS